MKHGLNFHAHSVTFPSFETPPWASRVDRWYQLDPYAFGIADAFEVHRAKLGVPSLILFAGPAASNETDWQFVKTGAGSPSKFVHTLPSARASALCQVMRWSGPTICLQKDPQSLVGALAEGAELLDTTLPNIWVVSASRNLPYLSSEKTGTYLVHLFELQYLKSDEKSEKQFAYSVNSEAGELIPAGSLTDREFLRTLSSALDLPEKFRISSRFEIKRMERA